MIVSFPDDATIQIFVVPSGNAPVITDPGNANHVLSPPASPAPKRSRRRDVLFLGSGVVLCIGVLMVVQGQNASIGRGVEPAHAARLTTAPIQPTSVQNPPSTFRPSLDQPASDVARIIPPAPTSAGDADPSATVRRLLASPPTITPPPGAASAMPTIASTSNPPAAATVGKRNSFGMSD